MKKFVKLAPLSLVLALPAFAQSTSDEALVSNQFIEADVQARLVWQAPVDDLDKDSLDLSKTYLALTGKFSEDIRANLRMELNQALRANGEDTSDDFDLDEFFRDANIEIRNIGGQPIAVIVGKQAVAFGEEMMRTPIYENNPLYNKMFQDRVLGVTVKLSYNLFDVADTVEASFFSSQEDTNLLSDGEWGTYDSASMRIKGQISSGIRYHASYALLGNEHTDGEDENKGAVGLLFAGSFDKAGNTEGPWVAWVNGLVTDKVVSSDDDIAFGVTGGASYDIGPGAVIVEATYAGEGLLESGEQLQLAIGYKLNLYTNDDGSVAATIAPEYRHGFAMGDNEADDTDSIGVALSFNLGTVAKPVKKAVFGPKKSEEKPAPAPAQ